MRCEVCGRKIHEDPITAVIEGARLTVCVECSKHGKIVFDEPAAPRQALKKPQSPSHWFKRNQWLLEVQITQEITEDYANKIRVAREKLVLNPRRTGQENK